MPSLETPHLLLRPFAEDDLQRMAVLMANKDFMRFSLGVYSREQTAGFLEKVRARIVTASLPNSRSCFAKTIA
jgi:RimJ/RimL family protein N-acetyltransferase